VAFLLLAVIRDEQKRTQTDAHALKQKILNKFLDGMV
jgi:hypothetical protein